MPAGDLLLFAAAALLPRPALARFSWRFRSDSQILKWAGALYLGWLAWQALKRGARSQPELRPA
jgi:threonine/homoserine/homoserine lactone efflux protein